MATIAGLVVEISARSQKFHREVSEIQRRAKRFASQIKSIIGTAVKAVVAGATAAAAAVTSVVTGTSLAMRNLVRDAEAVGATARDLQTWQVAAQGMGIEADKVNDIMKDVNDKIGDFARTGGGEAADIFEQMGLKASEFVGLSPDKALLRISSALDGLNQSEKIFFMESIADDASRLLPLLDNNAERFKALAEQGREWGTIMTEAEIKASAALGSTLSEAGKMATGFKQILGASLAPTFQGMIDWIRSVTESMGGPREAAAAMAEGIKKSIEFVANAVSGLKRIFEIVGSSIAVFALMAEKTMVSLAETIYSGPIDAINALLEGINKVTGASFEGVGQTDLVKDLQARKSLLSGAISAGKQDISDLINTPLAGDAMTKMIESATTQAKAANDAAQSTERFRQALDSATSGIMPTGSQSAVPGVAGAPSAGLNLRSITPMTQEQARAANAGISAAATKSRGSVHVTVTKDGKDVSGEVEGDDQFIKRLANALSGVAASA